MEEFRRFCSNMNILIMYYNHSFDNRNTISEHLRSFSRYSNENCYYINVFYGIPNFVVHIQFDLVIFHYTLFAYLNLISPDNTALLHQIKGYKVAIPQDEYSFSSRVNKFLSDNAVNAIYTCFKQDYWQIIYPSEKSGLQHYFTVFTGYVDERAVEMQSKFYKKHTLRPVDLGYRARKVPYWVGRFGLMKWQITDKFSSALIDSRLKYDLSNDENAVFYGKDWYKFLARCRVVLGCESGASLHDPDGHIRELINQYLIDNPNADFAAVEKACFPGADGNIHLATLSPRHFEACITRTCQALIEGEYGGVFKPGIHYIEIKKDWSNIRDVINQIEDIEYCEQIADNAYRHIVDSGLYTYRCFVRQIIDHAQHSALHTNYSNNSAYYLRLLQLREKYSPFFSPIQYFIDHIKYLIYRILVNLHLYKLYHDILICFYRNK